MQKTFNFSAGPAMLPPEVMQQAQAEFLDFDRGMSAMEISHRHPRFAQLIEELNFNLIKLLDIPKNYRVIWTTGGATMQFSMVPLNLMGNGFDSQNKNKFTADYLCTGHWSDKSAQAAQRYINVNKIMNPNGHNVFQPKQYTKQFSDKPLYLYYTPNETITGLKFNEIPDTSFYANKPPLVADMTSCILSEPIDINKFGMIFASAQKNMGHSGLTLIIIREDLLQENKHIPDITNYKLLADYHSILNTPPTYNFYMINLVLRWLLNKGGLSEIYKLNLKKAQKLYNFIDNSEHFCSMIAPDNRSLMNVTFCIKNSHPNKKLAEIEQAFISQAEDDYLFNLAGHRSTGGFRASIYNAMPEEGVDSLIQFMTKFSAFLEK